MPLGEWRRHGISLRRQPPPRPPRGVRRRLEIPEAAPGFHQRLAAPGLRIGAVCARGAGLQRLRMARLVDDFSVPGLMQETALQLVTAPSWPKHLKALRLLAEVIAGAAGRDAERLT